MFSCSAGCTGPIDSLAEAAAGVVTPCEASGTTWLSGVDVAPGAVPCGALLGTDAGDDIEPAPCPHAAPTPQTHGSVPIATSRPAPRIPSTHRRGGRFSQKRTRIKPLCSPTPSSRRPISQTSRPRRRLKNTSPNLTDTRVPDRMQAASQRSTDPPQNSLALYTTNRPARGNFTARVQSHAPHPRPDRAHAARHPTRNRSGPLLPPDSSSPASASPASSTSP